jgi:thymidylate synthase (FAD)
VDLGMSENQIKVELLHSCGDDLTTVNAARVSFDKESEWKEDISAWRTQGSKNPHVWRTHIRLSDKDTKLIHYLAKHKHYSPFGHCFASFRVTAPIFVCRQLVKHEYLRMNEVSRRYVDTPPEFYTPDMWRGKAVDKKQGSSEEIITQYYDPDVCKRGQDISDLVEEATYECRNLYDKLLFAGVAPEQARMVLPLSTMTSWWWSGSLDAFANMCKLRLKEDTQYETRLVAQQISDYMSNLYPVSWGALLNETD